MTDTKKKEISRRDALKVLGAAAGAAVLANLPSRWSTPELTSGVLPAHAQTSPPACVDYAVEIELLLSGGNLDQLASTPAPDEDNWNGLAGSTARWNCATGCLSINLFNPWIVPSTVRLTTISQQVEMSIPDGSSRYILIDMGTGEYAVDGASPPGNCAWPQ